MAPEPLPPAKEFVVFDSDLNDEWFERYRGTAALAVDTEAMGLVHGRDRLCLVMARMPSSVLTVMPGWRPTK